MESLRDRPAVSVERVASVREADVVAVAALAVPVLLAVTIAGAVALTGSAAFEGIIDRLLGFSVVLATSFATVGYLIARHDRGNRLALVTTAIAWGFALGFVLERYTTLGAGRGWPGVVWTLWVAQWVWMPAIFAILTVLPLRFPGGSLPSPRWRPVEGMALAGIAVATAGMALTGYGILDLPPAVPLDNPVAVPAGATIQRIGGTTAALAGVGSLISFVLRLVRSRGPERAQLLWPVAGLIAAVALVVASVVLGPPGAPLSLLGAAVLPASIAVAILRHGLWDVRLVVSRSLVYGTLTVAVLAVYVVTVAALGGVFGRTLGAPLVATVIVAVGADPFRRRVQRFSNRLVYGDREDPYAALSRLGEHLAKAGDRATLLADVTATVVRALRLRGAAIVVDDRVLAHVGHPDPADLELPLQVRGEDVGVLRAGVRAGAVMTAKDRRLLLDLARHVSATVHAERLLAELEDSRARLVRAREEERRRIRRDLHDGLGPTLAGIGLEVERVGVDLAAETPAAAARLDELAARLRSTVGDIRTLVEGLRPAALDELGLRGAIEQLVRELGAGPTSVSLALDGNLDDLPAAVDLAAYRIVSEAVTNVIRHAAADRCEVVLRREPHQLHIVIEDDGRGLAADASFGVGRRSMAERAHELGGTFTIAANAPYGTRVAAALPVVQS